MLDAIFGLIGNRITLYILYYLLFFNFNDLYPSHLSYNKDILGAKKYVICMRANHNFTPTHTYIDKFVLFTLNFC